MCEYCVDSKPRGEPLEKGTSEHKCEWMPDPEDVLFEGMDTDDISDSFATCERPATRVSIDSTTEIHLCAQHQRNERQVEEEGLDAYPLEQSSQFVTINAEAGCDYVSDLLSDSVSRCGESASHVKLMTQKVLFCEDHFPE